MDFESYCYKSISGPNETPFNVSKVFKPCFTPSLGYHSLYHIEGRSSETLCDFLLTIKETKPGQGIMASVSHAPFFSSSTSGNEHTSQKTVQNYCHPSSL